MVGSRTAGREEREAIDERQAARRGSKEDVNKNGERSKTDPGLRILPGTVLFA
jgi:hypothetical protein